LSLKSIVPTWVETDIVAGLLLTSGDVIVIESLYVLLARVLVFGETVTVEGAVPVVELSPIQLEVTLADQPRLPVPRLETWKVCGVGFKVDVPKKFKVVGTTERTAVLTARVTGMEIGELVAPGADSKMVALYVPSAKPAGLADTVSTPGVIVVEAEMVSQDAPLETDAAHEVEAPPAVMLRVCGGGVVPGSAPKTKLDGEGVARAAWVWTASTRIFV
jgi:hypothetical protein